MDRKTPPVLATFLSNQTFVMSPENSTIHKIDASADLTALLTGKMDDHTIAEGNKALAAATMAYGATGSVASMILYQDFGLSVFNGKTFQGNAGGIAAPGNGALYGDVYTSDINRLYNDTDSFAFTATPLYTAIFFYDKQHSLLGYFQAGTVAAIAGTGGGRGKWQ